MDMAIEQIETPDEALKEAVYGPLRRHNQRANSAFWARREEAGHEPWPLHLFAFGAQRKVLGGLFATTQFSWLKVELMATSEERRGQGIGRSLLLEAEKIARERGCCYAYVDTMEYQAPRFYEKAGYRCAGKIEDWDSHGHSKLFFVKDLS